MTKTFLLFLIIIIMIFFYLRGNEDTWLCGVNGWEKHGQPTENKPADLCINKVVYTEQKNKNEIENYLRENISMVSPIKETLGGHFYITKMTFNNSLTGKIEYEDGHIALKADFVFIREGDGRLALKSFKNI